MDTAALKTKVLSSQHGVAATAWSVTLLISSLPNILFKETLGHFYGVIGVLMAGFLGWLLGKSMLETRGFFWPWFIHFLQEVMIFAFMGIGSIVAGG